MPLWWDDVRFAIRRLRHQPGVSVVAVLTLALGLGANTAIFTLLYGVMMRPLPVTRPSELYRLGNTTNCCVNSGLQRDYSLFSTQLSQHLRQELTEFSDMALFQANTTVTGIRPPGGGSPISTPAAYVSSNYFRMLGVAPAIGRLLEPADEVPGAAPVMVMSYRAWMEQFSGDDSVVGRAFVVNGVPVTLAGVAAPEFFGETVRPNPAGLWLPLGQEPVFRGQAASLNSRPGQDWLYAIGRLRREVDVNAVSAHATRALQSWLATQSFLDDRDRQQLPEQRIVVTSAAGGVQLMRGNFGQSLTLLLSMSGLVLLIACANLANLFVAKADRVQAAIRAALGASAGRLVRQSLIEGVLLSLVGATAAVLVSVASTRAIVGLAFPAGTALPLDTTPTVAIVLFLLVLAIVTALLFSSAPAWMMSRTNPIEALRGIAREGASAAFMPRQSLVVIQVTLSLVLLAGAGLLSTSLSRLESQPMGFVTANRFVVRIDPPSLAGEPARLSAIYDAMRSRLEQIPGVERATYSLYSPMEGNNWSSGIAIAGRPYDAERRDSSSWNRVGPRYFETMGTKVLRGRGILDTDTPASDRIAVVNQAFVQRFFPDTEVIGARLGVGDAAHASDYRVVGVVEDVKYRNANRPTSPMIFFPVMQTVAYADAGDGQVQARSTLVRTIELAVTPGQSNLEPAIRRALTSVHPDLVVTRIVPMRDQVAGNFRNNRLLATLAASYALLALLLASLGLYGVTSYSVSRRFHEIGVRMALGADRVRIVRHVIRGALVPTAIGLVIGVPLALAAGNALSTQLYDVTGRDPVILLAAGMTLALTAAAAAAVPARRAAAVDPSRALRTQ